MPEWQDIQDNGLKNEGINIQNKIDIVFKNNDFSDEELEKITKYIEEKINSINNNEEKNNFANKILKKLKSKLNNEWKKIEEALNEISREEEELNNNTIEIREPTDETENRLKDNSIFKEMQSSFKNVLESVRTVINNFKTMTQESFNKLANNYKEFTQEELDQKKSALPEDTKKKLAENNINEEEYIQYTISRDKIYEQWTDDHTPETRDFLNNLKSLEDTLWIRNETARWLPLTANTATFEANPDLKKFKNSDPEISKLWNTSYFWKENIDTNNPEALKSTLGPYKKMELIYKDDANFPKDEKFQEISKKIFNEDYSNLTQEEINYYTTKLDGLNWWITDYIKWSAAQAPLTWILRYLDSYTWFDKETLQDRFYKWKDEFITMDDSTMRIEWIIDGNPLSFYYDTKDWQTKISCDDVLHIEKDRYEIYDWEWKYPRSDLKIKMPSTKDIVSNLQDIDQDTYKKILEGSSDAKEFKRKITDLINGKIKKTFPENDEIKTRMGRFTEKNLAAQAFDSALIGKTEYKKKINEQWEIWLTPIRRVLLLVDNTTEKSTSSDLIEFKWALKKLEWLLWMTVEEINKITDPVLRENLLKIKEGKEKENYENWEASIINFFKLFERKDPSDPEFKINIDDFSLFIDQWSKKENIRINNFSKEFKEAYEKMDPEKRLAQEQWKKIHELWEEKHERESEEADIELIASLEAMESIEKSTESNLW